MDKYNENIDHESVQYKNNSKFPIHVFHKTIQDIMEAYHDTLGFNYDYMGAAFLFATSLAIGNSIKLRVKKGWEENAVIWTCTVGKSGTGKTHPQAALLTPFRQADKLSFDVYQSELIEYNRDIQKKGSKTNGKKKSQDDFIMPELPKRQQFLLQDFTMEALCQSHHENPFGIGVFSDEILQWLENIGRYTKSGEEQCYISIWSGREININRRSQPHIYIPNPFINVLGSIQIDLLAYALGKNRQKSGFSNRILFAFPEQILREPFSDDEIADIYVETYNRFINDIISNRPKEEKLTIPLSKEALNLFKEWRLMNNNRINNEDDGDITGIWAKLEIYLLRLSLILQVMEDTIRGTKTNEVQPLAIQRSIELINYFEKTALRVNSIIKRYADPLNNYSMDKKIVYAALPPEFPTKEGESIALQLKMPRRTFFEFLSDDTLFKKVKHGFYEKKL